MIIYIKSLENHPISNLLFKTILKKSKHKAKRKHITKKRKHNAKRKLLTKFESKRLTKRSFFIISKILLKGIIQIHRKYTRNTTNIFFLFYSDEHTNRCQFVRDDTAAILGGLALNGWHTTKQHGSKNNYKFQVKTKKK